MDTHTALVSLQQLSAGRQAALQFPAPSRPCRHVLLEQRAEEAPCDERRHEGKRACPALQDHEDPERCHQIRAAAWMDAWLGTHHLGTQVFALLDRVYDLMFGGMVAGDPR